MPSKFAIVGHPNKGKSSLVATLAQNDAIAVSDVSGTTTAVQVFDFKLDNEVCYQLVDTPGFQRARVLLEQLRDNVDAVKDRRAALEAFVADESQAIRFPDEFQLLQPVLQGAAIIYVVDGAAPYSVDYEPEMELLQWTGQPRMALINPIGNADYVEEWRQVLDQYFSTVRVFNPLQSDFNAQIDLLELFSTLRVEWKSNLDLVINGLKQQRIEKIQQAARIIFDSTDAIIRHQVIEVASSHIAGQVKERLLPTSLVVQYQQDLRAMEHNTWRALTTLFVHANLKADIATLGLNKDDLFNVQSWQVWGLPKNTVISLAVGSGLAAGALVDVAVGGSSLMFGAVVGGVTAGLSATLWGDKVVNARFGGVFSLGRPTEQVGPVKNPIFAWAILGRQIAFANGLLHRNHARRDAFTIHDGREMSGDIHSRLATLSKKDQIVVSTWLLSRGRRGNPQTLLAIIETLISSSVA